MGTRDAQAAWRRERILDAALEVFAEHGIDGTPMKELGRAAGVAPGLVYHYFEGKEAVVTALLAERGFLPRLRALPAPGNHRPAAEALVEVLTRLREVLSDNTPLMRLFFAAAHSRPAVRDALHEFTEVGRGLLRERLEARVEAGELRPHDTAAVGAALFSAVALAHHTRAPLDVGALVDAVLTGVVARPASGYPPDEE